MKVETRGKYPGVKLHLEPDEAKVLINYFDEDACGHQLDVHDIAPSTLALKMGKKIKDLLAHEPGLLDDRSPEQIAAILAKEAEKAALQLEAMKKGEDWKKINPKALQEAMNKHIQKQG